MIIKKIEIEGFGKFQNADFEFKNGLNLVYGSNEHGKTTLMAFVKMMLYSSSAKTEKSTDLFKALRKKYRPWNGGLMSGSMEFESGGMTYRLQKEFLKSDATDKTSIFCITTGENVRIENPNEAGKHFLGMTLDEFERSVFMGQTGGFIADNASDSLAMRISNLSVSGDENISHEQILKRLSSAAEELISKSRKKGLLVESEARLEELNQEKQQLLKLEDKQKDIEAEILQLTTEINSLESDLNALSDLERLENAKKDLNAYYTLQNKLNLLKAVKNQLEAYDTPYDNLTEYIQTAKELNDKIEDKLALIQEATLRNDHSISNEEASRLFGLDAKCGDLRKDLESVRGRISALWGAHLGKITSAVKHKKLVAWCSLFAFLVSAATAFFFQPYGMILSLVLTFLGMGIFSFLFFTAEKKSLSGLDVQLSKRDFESSVRNLLNFDEDFAEKNPAELEAFLNSELSEALTALSDGLNALGISDIEELKSKSGKHSAERVKTLTNELSAQKEDFIALSCTVKQCSTFSSAKILYAELCDSLTQYTAITREIKTVSIATGIENTDEKFVADKIKTLGELIQNAPIRPSDSNTSILQIRNSLNEKRNRLNLLQSQIIRPERGMSELLKEFKLTRERVSTLKQRYEEISIATDVMNEAILDTNKGLGSHLSQKVSDYISKITRGKYSDVLVPRDLSLETRTDDSRTFHEWKYLSSGAIDKIYLALRLAMTDILADSHGALPLFLDDIFIQYDDESCMAALRFLKEYIHTSSSVSQIMFFTCHKSILEMAKNVFEDVNEIVM